MLVEEARASVPAEWSGEVVRVARKKTRVRQRRVVSEVDTWDVLVSVRSCVRVDVGTMRADPSRSGSHLCLRSRQRCRRVPPTLAWRFQLIL